MRAGAARRGPRPHPAPRPAGVTIPGAVRSWGDAHRRWGRLSRDAVLAPAIELARDGFPAWDGLIDAVEVAPRAWRRALGRRLPRRLAPRGRPWAPGELIRLPALARDARDASPPTASTRSTTAISADGRRAASPPPGAPFTAGRLPTTARRGRRRSRRLSRRPRHDPPAEQLRARRAAAAEHPRDLRAAARRPPSAPTAGPTPSGSTSASRRPSSPSPSGTRRSPTRGSRDVPVDAAPRQRPHHRARRATSSRDVRTRRRRRCRTLVGGTIYLAVVDAEGNAVSLIQSNAAGFGSGVSIPRPAIHSRTAARHSASTPGTRTSWRRASAPRTRCSPGCCSGTASAGPWVVAGSMGGDIQPQIHAQLVSALVDGGADIRTAVAAPRVVVEPAGWFAPPVAVFADGELAPGVARRARGARPRRSGGGPLTAASAMSTRSSWSTADRPPAGRSRRSRTRAPWGWPPSD